MSHIAMFYHTLLPTALLGEQAHLSRERSTLLYFTTAYNGRIHMQNLNNSTVWAQTYFKSGDTTFRVTYPSQLQYKEGDEFTFVVPVGLKTKTTKSGGLFHFASANIASQWGKKAGFSEIPSEHWKTLVQSAETWLDEGVSKEGKPWKHVLFDAVCIGTGVIQPGNKDLPKYDIASFAADFG